MAFPVATSLFAELPVWLRGLFLGVALAAPVGPIGLLCIRRTLQSGLVLGLATGLGAALADGFFAMLAAFGVSVVTGWLTAHSLELRLVGGLIMLVIAFHIWVNRQVAALPDPDERAGYRTVGALAGAAAGSFFLTFTNPITIVAILTLTATLGAGDPTDSGRFDATLLTAGIFLGSCTWWLTLCGITTLLRQRFSPRTICHINQVTAVLLGLFGAWILGFAAWRLMS